MILTEECNNIIKFVTRQCYVLCCFFFFFFFFFFFVGGGGVPFFLFFMFGHSLISIKRRLLMFKFLRNFCESFFFPKQ